MEEIQYHVLKKNCSLNIQISYYPIQDDFNQTIYINSKVQTRPFLIIYVSLTMFSFYNVTISDILDY